MDPLPRKEAKLKDDIYIYFPDGLENRYPSDRPLSKEILRSEIERGFPSKYVTMDGIEKMVSNFKSNWKKVGSKDEVVEGFLKGCGGISWKTKSGVTLDIWNGDADEFLYDIEEIEYTRST